MLDLSNAPSGDFNAVWSYDAAYGVRQIEVVLGMRKD